MDGLYDNLENYEEGKIIHDLRNENKELKDKIEEYSNDISTLQKEFDKLSSEYKKLEVNYSSLLKTAKAEIERKSKMITTLNIEKDKLVIQSLQTHGKSFIKNIKYNANNGNASSSRDTKERNHRSPVNTIHSVKQKDINAKNEIVKTEDQKNPEVKENIPERKCSSQVNTIANRRQSVPAASQIDNENCGRSLEDDEKFIRNQRGGNKDCLEKRIYRTSDTSSVDNKYSYTNQTARDSRYTSAYGRKSDDYYRGKDRYDSRQARRYQSPDRSRYFKDRQSDYSRNRSPQSDRYRRQRSRDRNSYHSINNQQDYETPPKHNIDRHSIKHKIQSQLDEPTQKRMKIDSYGEYLSGGREHSEREYCEIPVSHLPPEMYRSCQSPDHVTPEPHEHHFVKEIKHTSATPLEDPRLNSKKYILMTDKNKAAFTATRSLDTDLKAVNKTVWGLPKIAVPAALLDRPPSKCDNFVDQIYMNIDEVEMDESLEPGEIPSVEDEVLLKAKVNIAEKSNKILNSNNSENKLHQNSVRQSTSENPLKVSTSKYKIPKLNDKLHSQDISETPKNDSFKGRVISNESCTKQNKKLNIIDELCKPSETVFPSIVSSENNGNTLHTDADIDIHSKSPFVEEEVSIGTVERDLLLSDDASDNMDLLKCKSTDEKRENNISNENKVAENEKDVLVKESKSPTENSSKKDQEKVSRKESSSKIKRSKKKQEMKVKEQDKEAITKKAKCKKDVKLVEIKNKFTDLFGESSSLIHPEDLGIQPPLEVVKEDKFECMFDDTQSAVDLQLQNDIKVLKNKLDENVQLSEGVRSSPVNSEENASRICETEKAENAVLHQDTEINNMYENLNSEVSMDGSNVVIISTGMQPSCAEEPVAQSHSDKNLPQTSSMPIGLTALATSTPFKMTESMKSNEDQTTDSTSTPPSNKTDTSQTSKNIMEVNEPDVPDVRIFVKRRRKVKK